MLPKHPAPKLIPVACHLTAALLLLVPLLTPSSSTLLRCYKCYGKTCAEPETSMEVCASITNVCYARLEGPLEIRSCSNAATRCDLGSVNVVWSAMMTIQFPRYVCKLCNGRDLCNSGDELRRSRDRRKHKRGHGHKKKWIKRYGQRTTLSTDSGSENVTEIDSFFQLYAMDVQGEPQASLAAEDEEHPHVGIDDFLGLPEWMVNGEGAFAPARLRSWRGRAHALVLVFGASAFARGVLP